MLDLTLNNLYVRLLKYGQICFGNVRNHAHTEVDALQTQCQKKDFRTYGGLYLEFLTYSHG